MKVFFCQAENEYYEIVFYIFQMDRNRITTTSVVRIRNYSEIAPVILYRATRKAVTCPAVSRYANHQAAGFLTFLRNVEIWVTKLTFLGFLT